MLRAVQDLDIERTTLFDSKAELKDRTSFGQWSSSNSSQMPHIICRGIIRVLSAAAQLGVSTGNAVPESNDSRGDSTIEITEDNER